MTSKAQDTIERQNKPGDAPVSGELGASASQVDASQRRPIFGDSRAVCRAIVENLFGKRHWAAPWMLELCNADPQFLTHLADQPRGYAHFLCLIRLALSTKGSNGGDAQEMAHLLRVGNKRALLEKLFPSCPTDIIDLLHKLPKKPFHAEGYRMLVSALEDESMRSHFSQNKRVTESTICFSRSSRISPRNFVPRQSVSLAATIRLNLNISAESIFCFCRLSGLSKYLT